MRQNSCPRAGHSESTARHSLPRCRGDRRRIAPASPGCELKARCSSHAGCHECRRLRRGDPIDRPRRRSSGRGAVVGGQRQARGIDSSRPPFRTPPLRHRGYSRRIRDLFGRSLDHEIELAGGNAQGAARITGKVPPFEGLLTGLEPESTLEPQGPNPCHVRVSPRIDRRQPTRVAIWSPRPWCLTHSDHKSSFDIEPVDERQSVEVCEICRFHGNPRVVVTGTHRQGRTPSPTDHRSRSTGRHPARAGGQSEHGKDVSGHIAKEPQQGRLDLRRHGAFG